MSTARELLQAWTTSRLPQGTPQQSRPRRVHPKPTDPIPRFDDWKQTAPASKRSTAAIDLSAGLDPSDEATTRSTEPRRTRSGAIRHDAPDWDLSQLNEIEAEYQREFGQPLPVRNRGQGSIHNRWGYQHQNAADISLSPSSREGQALMQKLRDRNIPFSAFDRAIPGVATGPHIHIGQPSKRRTEQAQTSDIDLSAGFEDDLPRRPDRPGPRTSTTTSQKRPTPPLFKGETSPEMQAAIRAGVEDYERRARPSKLTGNRAELLRRFGLTKGIENVQRQQEEQARQEAKNELESRRIRLTGPGGMYTIPSATGLLHMASAPLSSVTDLFQSDEDQINKLVRENLRRRQVAAEPEVQSIRKEYGQMSAPGRVAVSSLAKGGAGLLRTAGGIASVFGIAENDISRWANQRADIIETGAAMSPLREERDLSSLITGETDLREVERGIPEKIATGVADLGVGLGQIILLKRATGLPFNKVLALEAAARNSDKPISEQLARTGEAFALGTALDRHMSRTVSAAIGGAPVAAQTGYEVSQGRMSPLDAAIATGINTAQGAILVPRKEAFRESRPAAEPRVTAPSEPATQPRFRHPDYGEVTVLEDQAGANRNKYRVAEVANPERQHFVAKPDLQPTEQATTIKKPDQRQQAAAAPQETPAEALPEQGLRNMAQRITNAEERFIESAMRTAGITRTEASKALAVFKKEKIIEIDPVGGQFTYKHGAFADRDVIRRAAGAKPATGEIPRRLTEPKATRPRTTTPRAKETASQADLSLAQFVRKRGGIVPAELYRGELDRLRMRDTGTTGLINQHARQGSIKQTADIMMQAANDAGYRDPKTGQPFENPGDFLYAVERDVAGDRLFSTHRQTELAESEFARQEAEYYAQKEAERAEAEADFLRHEATYYPAPEDAERAAQARVDLLESGRGAELYDRVESGEATDAEKQEYRALAKQYGINEAETEDFITGDRAPAEGLQGESGPRGEAAPRPAGIAERAEPTIKAEAVTPRPHPTRKAVEDFATDDPDAPGALLADARHIADVHGKDGTLLYHVVIGLDPEGQSIIANVAPQSTAKQFETEFMINVWGIGEYFNDLRKRNHDVRVNVQKRQSGSETRK